MSALHWCRGLLQSEAGCIPKASRTCWCWATSAGGRRAAGTGWSYAKHRHTSDFRGLSIWKGFKEIARSTQTHRGRGRRGRWGRGLPRRIPPACAPVSESQQMPFVLAAQFLPTSAVWSQSQANMPAMRDDQVAIPSGTMEPSAPGAPAPSHGRPRTRTRCCGAASAGCRQRARRTPAGCTASRPGGRRHT